GFYEFYPSYFHFRLPISSGGICSCMQIEIIQALHSFAVYFSGNELSFRIEKFHNYRMSFGKHFLFIFQDKGKMQGVTWPPYSPLSINKSFYTFLYCLTRHIKIA